MAGTTRPESHDEATTQPVDRAWTRVGKLVPPSLVAFVLLIQVVLLIREFRTWLPVFATDPDPAYHYLMAGVSLVTGGAPGLVYHPGIPLQLLLGAVAVFAAAVGGSGGIYLEIASDPEKYALYNSYVLAAIFIFSLSFAAWRQLKYWGLTPTLVFQLIMLYGLPIFFAERYQIWPESLLISFAFLTIGVLTPQIADNAPPSRGAVVTLGVLAALGITTKVLFAPILLFTLILIRRRDLKIYLGVLAGVSVLLLLPLRSRWGAMFDWFSVIIFSSGRHGDQLNTSAGNQLASAFTSLSGHLRWFSIFMVLLIAAWIASQSLARNRKQTSLRTSFALLVGLAVAFLPAARQSQPRDFVIALSLLATVAALASINFSSALAPVPRKSISGLAIAICMFLAAHGAVHSTNMSDARKERTLQIASDASSVEKLATTGMWALGYNVWTQDNALLFGSYDSLMDGYIYSDDLMNDELKFVAPNATYFDIWTHEFVHINDAGQLRPIPCLDLKNELVQQTLGVVLESENHLRIASDGRSMVVSGGIAQFDGPERLGRYFVYRLTSIEC